MPLNLGIVLFDRVEELDFAGPWEVLSYTALSRPDALNVKTVSESGEAVTCNKGLRVLPDCSFADCPDLDVILVPGGQGTRTELSNTAMLEFVSRQADGCRWITSVCSGVMILLAAGLAKGKRVTTHWAAVEELRAQGEITVLEGPRFVRDGNLVTSAGVSAGIDMSLWLLGQLFDPDFAREVQKGIEYFPAPPYSAEV